MAAGMLLLSGMPSGAAVDTVAVYTGTAVASGNQTVLYREQHLLHLRDGNVVDRVVLYACRDGTPFARKTVWYDDKFSPDFVLEDESNGMRQGTRTQAGQRDVFYRENRAGMEKHEAVPRVSGSVADSGFDAFVRANWQPLMDGNSVSMKFLVPSRLQEMSFKVQHLQSAQIDGAPVEVFRLKVSGLLGLVAPSIDVSYSAADHVLTRFVGVSDLRDAAGNNYAATIDFRPGDRKAGTEEALAEARSARLAPCR